MNMWDKCFLPIETMKFTKGYEKEITARPILRLEIKSILLDFI